MVDFMRDIVCGHCGRDTRIAAVKVPEAPVEMTIPGFNNGKPLKVIPQKTADGSRKGAATGQCQWCKQTTLLTYRFTLEQDPTFDWSKTTAGKAQQAVFNMVFQEVLQHPSPPSFDAPILWPENVRTGWADVIRARAGGVSPPMLVSMAGNCMQLAMRTLGAGGKTIANEIDDLHEKNIITGAMRDWAHHLRDRRNKGAHDFFAAPEDVEEGIEFLRLFLHLTFTLRLEMEAKVMAAIT